jgi:hypothetical protein
MFTNRYGTDLFQVTIKQLGFELLSPSYNNSFIAFEIYGNSEEGNVPVFC